MPTRLTPTALAATLLITSTLVPAFSDGGKPPRRQAQPPVVTNGGVGLPSYIPGIGTYAGGLSATRFPGNGNYFYWQGDGGNMLLAPPAEAAVRSRRGAKIIDVEKDLAEMNRDDESGVCIIRP